MRNTKTGYTRRRAFYTRAIRNLGRRAGNGTIQDIMIMLCAHKAHLLDQDRWQTARAHQRLHWIQEYLNNRLNIHGDRENAIALAFMLGEEKLESYEIDSIRRSLNMEPSQMPIRYTNIRQQMGLQRRQDRR